MAMRTMNPRNDRYGDSSLNDAISPNVSLFCNHQVKGEQALLPLRHRGTEFFLCFSQCFRGSKSVRAIPDQYKKSLFQIEKGFLTLVIYRTKSQGVSSLFPCSLFSSFSLSDTRSFRNCSNVLGSVSLASSS